MPRRDWNTPAAHTQNRHHKPMKSGAKGKGHDHRRRHAKRMHVQLCSICGSPIRHRGCGRKAQKPRA